MLANSDTAVIFDMDGTIFDSERLVLDCWEKIGEKHNITGIREVFITCIGTNKVRTKEIVYEAYGDSFPYDEFSRESSALFHETVDRQGLPVKKGTREILEFLRGNRIPMGVASSTRVAVVTEELKQAGLYDYFQIVMGGDQLTNSKPAPDIYLLACAKMGVEPGSAYAVEDSYNGIRSAYRAGMRPIMVPDVLPATDEMRSMSIAVLEDLLQVKEYLADALLNK